LKKIYLTSVITYLVAVISFTVDQVTKNEIIKTLPNLQQYKIVFPWLWFTHVVNYGAAWSTFSGKTFLLSAFAALISLGLIIYERLSFVKRTKLLSFSIGFLLGGAIGNLYDRVLYGRVTDFLDLRYNGQNIWPIFNGADISINIGIGLLILYYIFQDKKNQVPDDDMEDEEIKPKDNDSKANSH
jgi:signal peptidase II